MMKKWMALLLALAMAAMMMGFALAEETVTEETVTEETAAEEVDVVGFWYSEEDGSGIELDQDGIALLSDEEGELTDEGAYTADGANVTITCESATLTAVVDGNTMTINETGMIYVRDGDEVGYWNNEEDETGYELYDGQVWYYSADGEVLSEGTYTFDGTTLIMEIDGQTLTGAIEEGTMTIDGKVYYLL